jgi:hypothetical protein
MEGAAVQADAPPPPPQQQQQLIDSSELVRIVQPLQQLRRLELSGQHFGAEEAGAVAALGQLTALYVTCADRLDEAVRAVVAHLLV